MAKAKGAGGGAEGVRAWVADWLRPGPAVNSLPEIRIRDGIPVYESPYIRSRNREARKLLARCLAEAPDRYTADALWAERPEFPLSICFNVHSLCNERCVMCPYAADEAGAAVRFMDLDGYRRLWDEFVALGGRIATFNNFSDVFAHARGMDYVRIALGHAARAHTYFVTNGLALKAAYVDEVMASGWAGILYVSCHAFSADTFRKVTGIDGFDHVLKNARYAASRHPRPERIIVQYCADYSEPGEVEAARSFWADLGCSINVFRSHTFAGNSNHRETPPATGRLAGCTGWGYDAGQPFFQAVIQQNGNLTLCCHDLQGKVVVGNALESGLAAVWRSDRMRRIVEKIYRGRDHERGLDICRRCNMAQTAPAAS